jgi:hypothetical protein
MRLVPYFDEARLPCVASLGGGEWRKVRGATGIAELAMAAVRDGATLEDVVQRHGLDVPVDVHALEAAGRLRPVVDRDAAAQVMVSLTGLTHLGSAASRDKMHVSATSAEPVTDSMELFRIGVAGGKPAAGQVGAQPEWLWKGDGSILRGPGEDLGSPEFALDAGEEPEICGIYLVSPDGVPCRLGFALANEFSDHVMEKQNYLYLSHSKMRPCAIGGELLVGELPRSVQGASRIRRGADIVWSAQWLSGEDNMCHSIANLEWHHFKYDAFRRPCMLHVHCFGTASLSFADGFRSEPGDVFEIEADAFELPLRNRWTRTAVARPGIRKL